MTTAMADTHIHEEADELARSVLAGTSLDPDAPVQKPLPLFEGFVVPRVKVAFTGTYELDLSDEEYRSFADALAFGADVHLVVRGAIVGYGHKTADPRAQEPEATRHVLVKVEEVNWR